jgi:DNA processing protein
VIDALPALSLQGGRTQAIRLCSIEDTEAEIAYAARIDAHLIAQGEHGYPPAIANADGSRPLIYVKGRPELADMPIVSIAGARNGSAAGPKFTRHIANVLGIEGFVLASGLARGIDTAAHKGSLDVGTIAVVAGGIDIVYPPENEALQEAIATRGLLVSERPPGLIPRVKDFPRRNRLISGIALGAVVVEAAQRSGSLITARIAGEQGREVFAVPGSPLDPRASGTNNLIEQGATVVTDPKDIIDSLAPILGRPTNGARNELCSNEGQNVRGLLPHIAQTERERVIQALGPSPIEIDEIIRCTRLETRKVHIILLELDLTGRLQRHGRQLVSWVDAF